MSTRGFGVLPLQIENPFVKGLKRNPGLLAEPAIDRFRIAFQCDRLFGNRIEDLADRRRAILDGTNNPLKQLGPVEVLGARMDTLDSVVDYGEIVETISLGT